MAANTADEIDRIIQNGEGSFVSFGVDEMIESIDPNEEQYLPFVYKIRGARTGSEPTEQGNYLAYWEALRKRVYSLFEETLQPSSEVKPPLIKGGLIKDIIAPLISQRVEKEREGKKARDPEWIKRVDKELNRGRINLLLMGQGSEDASGETNIDAIIAASYSRPDNALNLVSLHRDTLVPETGEELMRTVQKGKMALIEKVVEQSTGLSMDYRVKLTIKGLSEFVNKVFGKLKINVAEDIPQDQYGVGFTNGEQYMDGARLYQYLSTRTSTSVERRNTAQQQVFRIMRNEMMARLKANNPLQNIQMLNNIKTAIAKLTKSGDIETDLDIESIIDETLGKWLDIALKFVGSRITGEQFFDIPEDAGLVVADYDMLTPVPGDTGPRGALRTYRDPKTGEPILGDWQDPKLRERFYEVPRARTRELLKKKTAP